MFPGQKSLLARASRDRDGWSSLVHQRGNSRHIGKGSCRRPRLASCDCCSTSIPLVALIRRGGGSAFEREACRAGGVSQLSCVRRSRRGGPGLLPRLKSSGRCAVSPEGASFSGEFRGPLRVLCWSSRRRFFFLAAGQLSFANELTVPQKAGHAVGRGRDRVAPGVHLYLCPDALRVCRLFSVSLGIVLFA